MLLIRSPMLFTLTSWSLAAFLAWFVVLIIGHSYSDIVNGSPEDGNRPNVALPLNEQSLQLFMYDTLLVLATLAACWYADFVRTKASRTMALTVSTFCTFAWMWNLWFVIPAMRHPSDGTNLYCNDSLTSLTRWCDLYRAAAGIAIGYEFGQFCCWLWALFYLLTLRTPEIPIPTRATVLAPHRSLVSAAESGAHDGDVAWNTELTEPDDLELLKIAANNPSTHYPIVQRSTAMGKLSALLTGLSLVGWLILTCALIDIARQVTVGLDAWDQTEPNPNRLGDPIVAANWYWLTLSLGVTLAASSYASHRRNRGVIGSAMLLTWLSALQWTSLFIYMARRDAKSGSGLSQINNAKHSQYAETAGVGIICVFELLRGLVLLMRYMVYMLVTKLDHDRVHVPSHVDAPTVVQAERDNYNPQFAGAYGGTNQANEQDYKTAHQLHGHPVNTEINVPGPSYDAADGDLYVPSYNMGIFHGSSIGFRFFFMMQALSVLAFWILMIIYQSDSGLFNPYQNVGPENGNDAGGFFGPASYAPDRSYVYNERMFLLVTVLIIGAWLPAFHAEREVSVASALASMYTTALMCLGFFLLVWSFAYESIYGNGTLYSEICTNGTNTWCDMTQASGILALINAFFMFCLFIHAIVRLADRRMAITVWERSVQNVPGTLATLIIAGVAIWAFSTLELGLHTWGLVSQLQSRTGWVANITASYFASQAFLTFVACALTVWVGTYASKLMYAWQSWAWRMASLTSSMVAAAFMIPLLIYACRFINLYDLGSTNSALTAGIIVLAAGTVFYFAAFCFLVHTAFYAAGPAGAALPPLGMVAKANPTYQTQQGVVVERDVETGAVVGVNQYTKTTAYAQTKPEPIVNPRTGDTVLAVDQYPTQEMTNVSQQPVVQTAPVTEVPVAPVNAVSVGQPVYGGDGDVRYHTYDD